MHHREIHIYTVNRSSVFHPISLCSISTNLCSHVLIKVFGIWTLYLPNFHFLVTQKICIHKQPRFHYHHSTATAALGLTEKQPSQISEERSCYQTPTFLHVPYAGDPSPSDQICRGSRHCSYHTSTQSKIQLYYSRSYVTSPV